MINLKTSHEIELMARAGQVLEGVIEELKQAIRIDPLRPLLLGNVLGALLGAPMPELPPVLRPAAFYRFWGGLGVSEDSVDEI